MLPKLITRIYFNNMFMRSFYAHRFQNRKKTVKSYVSFLRFWDLHAQKLLVKSLRNWLQESISLTCIGEALKLQIPKARNGNYDDVTIRSLRTMLWNAKQQQQQQPYLFWNVFRSQKPLKEYLIFSWLFFRPPL